MRKVLFICLAFALLNSKAQNQAPLRKVEILPDGVLVTYNLEQRIHVLSDSSTGSQSWSIPCFGICMIESLPEVPQRWDTFLVPDGKDAIVELVEGEYKDTVYVLPPAKRPSVMGKKDTEQVVPIKPYTGWFPTNLLHKGTMQYYRGQGMVKVCVNPLQYDYEHHRVRYYTKLCYKVSFKDSSTLSAQSGENVKGARRKLAKAGEAFLRNVALNSTEMKDRINRTKSENQSKEDIRDYLIVCPKEFVNSLSDFISWKQTQGYRVACCSMKKPVSCSVVADRIKEFYDTAENPYYLLLVGDAKWMPQLSFRDSIDNVDYDSDRPYVLMDDDDDIPDMSYGRIPARSEEELSSMLQKIMHYEHNPCVSDDFYKNATCVSVFMANSREGKETECAFSVEVSEQIRESLLQHNKDVTRIYNKSYLDGKDEGLNPLYYFGAGDTGLKFVQDRFVPSDLRIPNFMWDGSTDDIISQINKGTFLTLGMVHCEKNEPTDIPNWICPNLTSDDVMNLTNGEKQTVLFSPACESGRFDDDLNWPACAFLRNSRGGAVGVIAPSNRPNAGYADAFIEGCINAVWPNPGIAPLGIRIDDISLAVPEYELGGIMQYGSAWMSQFLEQNTTNLSDPKSKDANCYKTNSFFHCLGDPSMQFFTEKPKRFETPTLRVVDGVLTVQTVEDDVRLSFCDIGQEVISSVVGNYTEIDWAVAGDINSGITLCLTKPNYIPYIVDFGNLRYFEQKIVSGTHVYYSPQKFYVGRSDAESIPPVTIQDADITIHANGLEMPKGTLIINSEFKYEPLNSK